MKAMKAWTDPGEGGPMGTAWRAPDRAEPQPLHHPAEELLLNSVPDVAKRDQNRSLMSSRPPEPCPPWTCSIAPSHQEEEPRATDRSAAEGSRTSSVDRRGLDGGVFRDMAPPAGRTRHYTNRDASERKCVGSSM